MIHVLRFHVEVAFHSRLFPSAPCEIIFHVSTRQRRRRAGMRDLTERSRPQWDRPRAQCSAWSVRRTLWSRHVPL